jgi:hypothetical protein
MDKVWKLPLVFCNFNSKTSHVFAVQASMPFDLSRPHCIPMVITFLICVVLFCYKFFALIPGLWDVLYNSPGGHFCIYNNKNRATSEDLKPFSQVYEAGELANEDDDYYMDELEGLRKLQKVFLEALDKSEGQEDPELLAQCRSAVEITVGKSSDDLNSNGIADHLEEQASANAQP